MAVLSGPQMRYPDGRGHMVDPVYVDKDGYEIHQPQRRSLYQEDDHHAYGRTPIRYVDNHPIVGNAPPWHHHPQALRSHIL